MATERYEFATVDYPFDFHCGSCGFEGHGLVRGRGEERRRTRRARDTAHKRALGEARQLARLAVCPKCDRRPLHALARWMADAILGLAGLAVFSMVLWSDSIVIEHPLVNRAVVVMLAVLFPVMLVRSLGMFGRARREVRWQEPHARGAQSIVDAEGSTNAP